MMIPVALFLVLLAGCAPSPKPADSAAVVQGQPRDTTVVGSLRTVGSGPMDVRVVLQDTLERSWWVEGAPAGELRTLAGTTVEVRGRADGRTLHVTGYTLRGVDGRHAEIGTVERAPDGGLRLRTEDGRLIQLIGGAQHLRPGQKVWVQGPETLQVQRYGVIREP